MSDAVAAITPVADNDTRWVFRRHLDGDYSLGRSYWLHTFVLQSVLGIALVGTSAWLSENFPARYASISVLVISAAMYGLWIWAISGTWASANKHVSRGGRSGWASAAKVAIILGVLKTLGDFGQSLPAMTEHLKVASGWQHGRMPTLQVRADGKSIQLAGGIQDGTAEQLDAAVKLAPAVKTIVLSSEGGWIREGERVADVIRGHGLNTYVEDLCSSACTIAFLAGVERAADPGAKIGFHAPRYIGGVEGDNSGLRRLYEAAGLPASFVDRAMNTPNGQMWYPTHDELMASGTITRRSGGGETAAIATNMRSREALEREMKKSELFALYAEKNPQKWREAMEAAWATVRQGASDAEVVTVIRNRVLPQMVNYLPRASDEVLVLYHALMVEQLRAVRSRDLGACVEFAFPSGNHARVLAVMPAELKQKELDMLTRILRALDESAPRKMTPAESDRLLRKVFTHMTPRQLEILADEKVRGTAGEAEICATATAFFNGIGAISTAERGKVMRAIYSN